MRVGGRVDPNLLSCDGKYPALLPYDHWISTLITRDAHRTGHPGVAARTAKTRRKYWIIKGNNVAKIVKHRCTFCREMEAKVETQLMANLPSCRQQPYTTPFLYTSCDYFGPMKVKVGRNKTAKHDGVIFTCHVPQHESSSLRAGCRPYHYGISTGFEKVFLIPWLSQGSPIRQRFTNVRS